MKKNTLLLVLFALLSSCASVSQIEPGRYAVDCHYLMSEESCASEVTNSCPNGYQIISGGNTWSFFEGAKKKIFVNCKDKRKNQTQQSSVHSKLQEQGYVLSKNGSDVFAQKEGKVFKVTDSQLLCSEAEFDSVGAEAKGYVIVSDPEGAFLVKGDRKIPLSKDKKHICKAI